MNLWALSETLHQPGNQRFERDRGIVASEKCCDRRTWHRALAANFAPDESQGRGLGLGGTHRRDDAVQWNLRHSAGAASVVTTRRRPRAASAASI
jgi:anti-sigma regulatory factor (Ser/Thr protein kinase)